MTAEASGQRSCSNYWFVHYFKFYFSVFSISLPIGDLSYFRFPIGVIKPFSRASIDPTGHKSMASWAFSGVSWAARTLSTTTCALLLLFLYAKMLFPCSSLIPLIQRLQRIQRFWSLMINGWDESTSFSGKLKVNRGAIIRNR